jgi:orotate phosphoribosyltransferase
MNLFRLGRYTLHSGAESFYKVECEAFSPDDWKCLAYLLACRLPPFGAAVGVPRGGLPLADALGDYVTPGHPLTVVADDVYTTGNSLRAVRASVSGEHVAAVVFGRNPAPLDVVVLCPFPRELRRLTPVF